jgi:hypothetical protein
LNVFFSIAQIILICIYINGYETQKKTTCGCFSNKEAATGERTPDPYETRCQTDADADKWVLSEEKPHSLCPVFFSGKKGSCASTH